MKYDWDINELMRFRNKLKLLSLNKNLSENKLKSLKIDLANLEEMINLEKNPNYKIIVDEGYSSKFYDKNKLLTLSNYNRYMEVLPYIKSSFNRMATTFGKYKNDFIMFDLPVFKNTKDLIAMGYEVYNRLPTNDRTYLDLYLKYTNPNNHYLKEISSINSNDFICGYSYLYTNPKYKPYTLVALENRISDLETLNHEIGHLIFFDPSITTNNRSFYLQEVEGYYFEEATRQYLRKVQSSDIVDQLEYERFATVYNQLIDFYVTDLVVKKYSKNKNISKDELLESVIDDTSSKFKNEIINEAYINSCLTYNTLFNSKYLVSYLVYLDIKEISKHDPEFGLYTLKQVCKVEGSYIYPKLRELGITYMDDGYANLSKMVKKMNKKH